MGNADASFPIARTLGSSEGHGVPKKTSRRQHTGVFVGQLSKAMPSAATMKRPYALFLLLKGEGGPKDVAKALKWFRKLGVSVRSTAIKPLPSYDLFDRCRHEMRYRVRFTREWTKCHDPGSATQPLEDTWTRHSGRRAYAFRGLCEFVYGVLGGIRQKLGMN